MRVGGAILLLGVLIGWAAMSAERGGKSEVSFSHDVFPVIKARCLPCHAEDNFNPSELSLDSYDLLMQGGKNGVPVVAGKAEESLMIKKLGEKPPFGDRMPLNKKQAIKDGTAKYLSASEIKLIERWINEGALNN